MQRSIAVPGLLAALALSACGSAPPATPSTPPAASTVAAPEVIHVPSGPVSKEEVRKKIQAWLDRTEPPLRYEIGADALRYDSASKAYAYVANDYRLLFGFERPLPEGASPEVLRGRFRYSVVDAVPLPIDAPGWKLRLMTPQSSTGEGLTIESHEGGRLRASLEWRFFAVHAERTDCQVMADAPMPDDCYVRVERDLPFSLQLDLRFEP